MDKTSIETTCPYCGVGCGIEVTPKADSRFGDVQVKVVGDKAHPANYGKLV